MDTELSAIRQRRAIRELEPVTISEATRQAILEAAALAPSSFNLQPYKFYWVESREKLERVALYCLGQKQAKTASALVVAVADLTSWRATLSAQLDWMKQNRFSADKIAEYERKTRKWRWFFLQGWFSVFGAMKCMALRLLSLRKIVESLPCSHRGMLGWATKGTALACENLMIAAEVLGLNTCPMEGFDGRRLKKFLELSPRKQEIVMVIAIGKKALAHEPQPRWRRPLEATVTVL